MGWASQHIERLQRGETVKFRPHGNSMQGRIKSGALVTVRPLQQAPVVGDIVLCKVRGAEYLHLVTAVQGDRFQIGNNKGHINGWIGKHAIYGECVLVEP